MPTYEDSRQIWIASDLSSRHHETLIAHVWDIDTPTTTVGIGGFRGTPFRLCLGKQGYEDGALLYYFNHNGYMGQYRIAEDVVYKFRSIAPHDMQPYIEHHWELEDKKVASSLAVSRN